jgi:hypothetical protein
MWGVSVDGREELVTVVVVVVAVVAVVRRVMIQRMTIINDWQEKNKK